MQAPGVDSAKSVWPSRASNGRMRESTDHAAAGSHAHGRCGGPSGRSFLKPATLPPEEQVSLLQTLMEMIQRLEKQGDLPALKI